MLSFIGDIMAHDVNYSRLPYEHIYKRCSMLLKKDNLTFANLEFPICNDRPLSNYPLFNVHEAYVVAAIENGIEVFSMANNHITDQGKKGVISTWRTMEGLKLNYDIHFSGIRESVEEPFQPISIPYNNVSIGFIAITGFLNNGYGSEHVHLVPYTDDEARSRFLLFLKEHTPAYDLFIVSFHGGNEYARIPNPGKMQFFKDMCDAGVNIIWAHHPHVLQPWFLLHSDENAAVLLPSCGNFISGQTWNLNPKTPNPHRVHTGESAIYTIKVFFSSTGPRILNVTPYPIVNFKHPEYGMITLPLDDCINDEILSEEWKTFYISRVPIIQSILADNAAKNIMR